MLGRQTFIDVGAFAQPRNHEVLGFKPRELINTRHTSDIESGILSFLTVPRIVCCTRPVLASIHRSGRRFGLRCSNSQPNTSMQHHPAALIEMLA